MQGFTVNSWRHVTLRKCDDLQGKGGAEGFRDRASREVRPSLKLSEPTTAGTISQIP